MDSLKQFIYEETHEGTLYYLLNTDVGKEILTGADSRLKNKIMLNKDLLLRPIISGEHKGKSLQDLYDTLFPTKAASTHLLVDTGFFGLTSNTAPTAFVYQSENKM